MHIMLKRKIYSDLLEWKGRMHKCLLVTGQRQIGKTFIIRKFAEDNYSYLAELNFSTMREVREAFDGDLTVDSIIARLSIIMPELTLIPGKTLLFFDEIQDCDGAFASLKQFTEDGRYDVIASGSLMSVKLPELKKQDNTDNELVPMGYDEYLQMFALDFEEFLWARGVSEKNIQSLKDRIKDRAEIDPVILKKMNSYFREFMIIGGMPAAVSAFIADGTFTGVRKVLNDLKADCLRDINRYNRGVDIVKTTECFESIPDQLAESNKKFMYSRIDDGQTRQSADKYMENLLWIRNAGYGNFCYGCVAPVLPLRSKRDVFKVYLSDTGMLVNRYGDNCIKAIYMDNLSYNLGSIAENEVAECLMKAGYVPRYFTEQKGEKRMELDFVLETGNGLTVLEVKSGKSRNVPSIGKASRFYNIDLRIILSEDNIFTDGSGMLHLPLFASAFLRELEPVWDGPAL